MSVQTLLKTLRPLLLLRYLKCQHRKRLEVLLHLNPSDCLVELRLVVLLASAFLVLGQFNLDLHQVLLRTGQRDRLLLLLESERVRALSQRGVCF